MYTNIQSLYKIINDVIVNKMVMQAPAPRPLLGCHIKATSTLTGPTYVLRPAERIIL